MGPWGYPRYVSVAEKRAKAARKLKQLKKKNPDIKPILLEEGPSLAPGGASHGISTLNCMQTTVTVLNGGAVMSAMAQCWTSR